MKELVQSIKDFYKQNNHFPKLNIATTGGGTYLVQSLFEDQVKSENLEIAKQKKKTLQQPNHRRSNSAFTDMWFLGLLTLLLEPLMIFLVYLFIK